MQKTKINTLLVGFWLAFSTLFVPVANADEGHGPAEAPAADGEALPRFTATSEMFELVGVVNGKNMTLYLDHYADGSPVKDARLELELDGVKLNVVPHDEGEFEATLAQELKPGVMVVQATVVASEAGDLLVGELDVHDDAPVAGSPESFPGWKAYALWFGAGGGILLCALFFVSRLRASRKSRFGGAV